MALHQGAQYHFTEDIWPVGGGKMNAIIQQLAAWCEEMPTVTRHPQYQEKEQIVFTKKVNGGLLLIQHGLLESLDCPATHNISFIITIFIITIIYRCTTTI